jgi:hypothetical protein
MNAIWWQHNSACPPNKSSATTSFHTCSHFSARLFGDRVHFIGGTALARTHLRDGRLSEDIDLIAIDDRKSVAAALDAALPVRFHARMVDSRWNQL